MNITPKDHPEEFLQLCHEMKILYPSTIHHFEKDVRGIYFPVLWGDMKVTASEGRQFNA